MITEQDKIEIAKVLSELGEVAALGTDPDEHIQYHLAPEGFYAFMIEPLPEKPCAFCKNLFTPKRRNQDYDTEKCRKAAYWSKHEVITGSDLGPALAWALAKLNRYKEEPQYKQLLTLLDRIR